MGYVKDIQDDLLALAARDGAVIEQLPDGSRKVTPVVTPTQIAPTPATRPPERSWSD